MVGVLFIVTIPTEQEERNVELNENHENHVKFGHSSNVDIPNKENDKFEYGTFKIVRNQSHRYFNVLDLIVSFVSFKCIFRHNMYTVSNFINFF